jgi:hypothetical protein
MHQKLIVDVALVFASLCFLVYVVLTLAPVLLAWIEHRRDRKPAAGRETVAAPIPIDFSGLVKAFATLVDSLVKAGPALWALIGSMLFLLIAGFAAGLFTTAP